MANREIIGDPMEIGFPPNRNGFVRFDNQSIPITNIEKLKYPKGIDPFRIRCEILFTIITCLIISAISALIFLNKTFHIENPLLQSEDPLRFHGYLCGLILASFIMMICFIIKSRFWLRFIRNSGFYYFPKVLERSGIVVVFTWSCGIFFFNIPLILEESCLKKNKTLNYCQNLSIKEFSLLQVYIGIATFLTNLSLLYYLIVLVRFRIQRRWPDIWHERLLEESELLESCPLIMNHELRIDNHENAISVSHQQKLPTEADIMKIQAYVIKYLRQLNDQLSRKIYQLENQSNRPYVNYGSTLTSNTIERRFDPSI